MNLTMNISIIELSFHACNFAFKVLDREEPGARFWLDFGQNYNLKLPFFKKSVYLPAFLHNIRTYTIIYFIDPIIKTT